MSEPLVSVVLNNHDYARFLGEAIESALAQTYPNTEIVVVDDGSTDGSREVIASYGGRVRAVFQENAGQAAALNAGFAGSQGEIVCLLDSDDVAYPERVARVVAAFREHPGAGWLRHSLRVVDAGRRPTGPRVPEFHAAGPVVHAPRYYLEGRVQAATSGIALRRAAGERVFPLPTTLAAGDTAIPLVRDADAYLVAGLGLGGAPHLSLAEVLGDYRRHAGQQFLGVDDLVSMLERQVEVSRGLAALYGARLRGDATPSSVFKHRAIIAALRGAPLWSAERIGPGLRGVRAAARLLPANPCLALRQAVAVAFATFLPELWKWRLLRAQGFVHPPARLPPPRNRG